MIVSAIDYAVISQALHAASNEMGAKLIRSAYSTVLREARDGASALLDREGNVVAQADLIPMQLGPMGMTIRPCLALYPVDELVEGDFFINNDPFNGGQHLPDVFIFTPIFFDGRVIGFGASVAHHLDLGGGSPGLNSSATDIFQEGLRIPPSKYNMQRDWNGGAFERLVAANVRVPDLTIGDFNAQHSANAIGSARVRQLCVKYGVNAVTEVMAEFIAYSERRMRHAIAQIPNGIYLGEDAVDDDGVTEDPLKVKVKVEVRDDEIFIDFTGTCAQVMRNVNCPLSSTHSAALNCIKSVVSDSDIPYNEGVKRPIHITVPAGTLLNPTHPAPVRARMEAAYRAFNAIMKALSHALPARVIASGFDTTAVICFSRQDANGYRISLEVFGGGYGASSGADGCDAVDSPLSNCSNTPVEALDAEYDFLRVTAHELTPDSFGHGAQRGGAGFSRRYAILRDGVKLELYADRFRIQPEGLYGGTSAAVGRCVITRGGTSFEVKSKSSTWLQAGDIVELYCGGGAGYGHAATRSHESIRRDLASGLLSPSAAKRVYDFAD